MEKVIERALDFIKIPSISGNEAEIKRIIDLVKEEFDNRGFFIKEFHFDKASPVLLLSTHDTQNFDILAIGHLDVVPAENELFKPVLKDGRIYARGAVDMKSQVSINLDSLEYAAQNYPDLKFGVLITTDEETTSNGIRGLAKHEDINAKIVFDNDAGSLDYLVEKYKHPVSVKITASGYAAHSSMPWLGSNAIVKLMACINELQKHFPYYDKDKNIPADTWIDTMTVTALNSPTTYNVVPAEAEARLNFRLTEKTSLEKLENLLKEAAKNNGCCYEILLSSSGVYMNANHPIIKKYRETAAEILGHELKVTHTCGATDSRPFGKKSVIIMHSLNGGELHGDNEYVETDSILKLSSIQKRFIDKIA